MPKQSRKNDRLASTEKFCSFCQTKKQARGFSQHLASCEKKQRREAELVQLANLPGNCLYPCNEPALCLDRGEENQEVDTHLEREDHEGGSMDVETGWNTFHDDNVHAINDADMSEVPRASASELEITFTPEVDDIKVEYHPKSGRPPQYYTPDKYPGRRRYAEQDGPCNPKPWDPFRTRLDFEIAELMLDCHMNLEQSSALLSLFKKAIDKPEEFTLSSSDDLERVWTDARKCRATGFEHKTFVADYKDEEIQFQISKRSIWNWIEDVVEDPNTAPLFTWNAERHFRYNGSKWERIIDEPWTANDWWDIESNLPNDASPVFLIIYADKSRLSSFGTAKGYPVFARIANLPVDVRNGTGFAGVRLVGWLPVVTEDPGETGKKGYVNFKRVVWHKSLYEILDSIRLLGKTGHFKKCGDDVWRCLYPIILILCADYEEQCVMALVRGLGSLAPCPVCLVPAEKLSTLSETYDLRTQSSMMKAYEDAQNSNAADAEAILKKIGLRGLKNVFWDMHLCDVYRALSWDGLHAHEGGLFSDHILVKFKGHIDELGKKFAKQVDKQVDMTPRWRGLNHFSEVMKVEFTDGGKYADIAKLLLYAAYNILTPGSSPAGFALLIVLRNYLDLHMYTSLTLHTESTIAAGEAALLVFEESLQEYEKISPEKSWNFPKAHTHQHAFDDILRKGATRNFSTKPNEKAHSPLKDFYQLMTNFKNFGTQVLKLDEKDVVSTLIREQIDLLDSSEVQRLEDDTLDATSERQSRLVGTEHVSLSSSLASRTIDSLESFFNRKQDSAFKDFRKRLSKSLTAMFKTHIKLGLYEEICPYQTLRVSYASVVSSCKLTDIVRAHPSFHNRPRYDCILVDAGEGKHFFAQLLYIFGIHTQGDMQHLALILPYDKPIPTEEQPSVDEDLGFTRLRARHRSEAAFIHVESIVRGVVLTPAHDVEYDDEFLVFDQLDEDLWMRMKSIQLDFNVPLA